MNTAWSTRWLHSLSLGSLPSFKKSGSHILAETVSVAWHQPELKKRAVQGAKILRDIYEATPEQKLRFESVVASRDGDVCYFVRTWDARQSPELAHAFFEHDAERVRYGLELRDVNGQCDGPGSRDLSVFVEKAPMQ